MSWNGSGTFNRIYSWVADAAAGLDISASRMDTDSNDIASNGFGNCLTRDGQGIATANLGMGGFRHTNVGNGVAASDYATLGQISSGSINWVAAGGTADAITATYSPAVTLTDGQLCGFRASAANATTAPTFAPNGLTAHTITRSGGAALVANDIPGAAAEVLVRYNLANTRWEMINPASPRAITVTSLTTPGSGTYTTPLGSAGCSLLRIKMIGGGGGGGSSGTTTTGAAGTAGNDTIFNGIHAAGGGGGQPNSTGVGGAGGTGGSGGTGSATLRIPGGTGGSGLVGGPIFGGPGGAGPFGGEGYGTGSTSGTATANSGAGGGGGLFLTNSAASAGGGGAGEYVELIITSPSATYSYTVGATAAGGAAGSSGTAGGGGAAGRIIIEEYYR